MRTLRLYVLRLHLVPWLLGFGVVTYLLQLDFLVDIMDLLVARGIPIRAVGELFVLSLAWMVALSVPCGVLVASLMTFGRMAQDNEITALKASGINVGRRCPSGDVAFLNGGGHQFGEQVRRASECR